MFCPKCGTQAPDGTQFCPKCGNAMGGQQQGTFQQFSNAANDAFDQAERGLGETMQNMHQTFANGGAPYAGERLEENRSLLLYIVLSIVTCGIYGYWFIYKMSHDVNIACAGDGEKTAGLVQFIVLSIITCGIYAWIWEYGLGNRLASNAPRYGMQFQENGTTVLLWCLFGALLCGIGPYVAMHILIKNSNKICGAYNRQHGM